MNHIDMIKEHCEGQDWNEVPFAAQDEILAQYVTDEGFDVLVAGCPEHRMNHVFVELLADMVATRSTAGFADAGKAFAAAAYSLARAEAEFAVELLWQEACDDYWSEHPDADADYLRVTDSRERLEGLR